MRELSHLGAGATVAVDVVVVGAGVAGLVTALDLLERRPDARIAILDKGTIGSSGSTPLAQGGMAAAVAAEDSAELHAADTLRAGDGLADPRAVAVMAAEGPARIADLVRRGAVFDRAPDGTFSLAREGGQTVARSVRTADATGAEIFRALRIAATGRVTRLQGVACALATDPADPADPVVGVWGLLDPLDASATGPSQEGGLVLLLAGAVVLATGGCGGLYAATTNRAGATADGVALAHRAGAALVDLEFVQFHPTGLRLRGPDGLTTDPTGRGGAGEPPDPAWRLLLTEALRGAGATLVDEDGRRFLRDRHPDAELAPRHVVAKAILDQPGGAWLDARGLGAATIAEEFPTVAAGARCFGFDLASEPVPVEPCEHYMIGGVATDLWGRTSVPGLWAVGEVASTGVHGANRMAGNSLLQSCVFGHRAAEALAEARPPVRGDLDPTPPEVVDVGGDPTSARQQLRAAMSAGAGAVRSAEGLAQATQAIQRLTPAGPGVADGAAVASTRAGVELVHACEVARLMVTSATLRTESRGVHWREDHPTHLASWSGVRLRVQRPAQVGVSTARVPEPVEAGHVR